MQGELLGLSLEVMSLRYFSVHFYGNIYSTLLAAGTVLISPSVDIVVKRGTILFETLIRGKKKKGRAPNRGVFEVVIFLPIASQGPARTTPLVPVIRLLHPQTPIRSSQTRCRPDFRPTFPNDTAHSDSCPRYQS